MIGNQVKGAGFRGLLDYLDSRDDSRLIGGNMAGKNPRTLAAEFKIARELNPKLSKAVYHASLSLPPNEQLSDEQWKAVAADYLEGMGFSESQYAVYHHADTEHDHIHIVASRIQITNGKTVSDSWDYRRSENLIRKLEQKYGLEAVAPSWEKDRRNLTTPEWRRKERTGEILVKEKLQDLIDLHTQDNPTMPELINRLKDRGVDAKIRYTKRTGKIQGITYSIDGITTSGTKLGRAYTFPGLQKHRGITYDQTLYMETRQASMRKPVKQPTISPQQIELNKTPHSASRSQWETLQQQLFDQYRLSYSLTEVLKEKGFLNSNNSGDAVWIKRPFSNLETKNEAFWISTGEQPTRAVITDNPIEAVSAFLVEFEKKPSPTLYLSINSTKELPMEILPEQILVSLSDKQLSSETMKQLPNATKLENQQTPNQLWQHIHLQKQLEIQQKQQQRQQSFQQKQKQLEL